VTCAPILTVTGGTLVATTSLVMTGPIATVSDLDTGDPASALTATISWGDGQTTPGVALVGSNGAFTVSSSHVYAAAGTPSVTVTVTDPSTGASASATFTATVRPTSVITEFPVSVESYLGGITSFDGALWFADEGTSSIGVCTTSGAITEYAARGTTDAPFAVAPGVNNDLWFVASSQNYVADMNTAGTVISENSPPAANSLPFALAAGSDGNMWMVQEAGYVSSIAPGSFAIAQYAVAAGTLYGIAAGADGNLWFTDSGNNAIRTINPTTHTISSYPIPTASSSPDGICSGPDSNLWFVESGGNNIGRINVSTHVVTEFPIPTASASPFAIASGPDGSLWFTEEGLSRIGRVTPTGVFTEFPVPTFGSNVFGITAGPDGNVWFTEQSGQNVGRLTP
jgi:streptogramin lyase